MLVAPIPTAKTGVLVLPTKVTDNGFRLGETPIQGAARFRQNHNNAQPATLVGNNVSLTTGRRTRPGLGVALFPVRLEIAGRLGLERGI
jgi:hypothetical protein